MNAGDRDSGATRGQLRSGARVGGGGGGGAPPAPAAQVGRAQRWRSPGPRSARAGWLILLAARWRRLCVRRASPLPLAPRALGARSRPGRPGPAAPRPEAPGSAAMALRRLGAALLLLPLLAAVEGERAGVGGGERPGTGGRRRPPPPCGPQSLPRGSRRAQVAAGRCVRPRREARAPRAPGKRRALIDCARRRRRDHLAEAL